jgi:TP901 family phage tail tape measure protein
VAAFTQAGIILIAKGIGKYQSDLARADKANQKLGKNTDKLGVAFSSIAKGGLLGITSGLVAFGKAAIAEGRAFTSAMSNVGAISGATGKQFEALENQAKRLGATTKFTAVEAAAGQKFLAQAGFETGEIIGALPGTLNLAAAANLDLGKSADIVSNVLTAFGATAESTGQFVDVLTNTFTTSNTDLQQLGQAMKFAAPIAKNLGISVETTAAAIGTLSNAGIQGALAGTTLRGILTSLSAPTKKAQIVLDELGVSIFDADGKMRSLPDILNQVSEATSGMSDEQKTLALKTIVGTKRLAGFQVLLESGGDALEQYSDDLGKSGTAADVAGQQLDNLEGDITLLNSAFSGFKLAAFELMEPTLRNASKALTGFLTRLTEGANAWNQVFEDVGTIREWQQENVRAALEAGKSYGPYQRQVEIAVGATENLSVANEKYIGTAAQITIANEEQAKGASKLVGASTEAIAVIEGLTSATADLTGVETDEAQQSVELNRLRNVGLFTIDESAIATNALTHEINLQKAAREAAIEAEQREIEMLTNLAGTQAEFFTGIRSAREDALASEQEFNASISSIRASANEEQVSAQESTNEKLISLEEQRAAEEHRILTGAHARTTAENDALLAANNAHFEQLKTAEQDALTERQAAIDADFASRESKAQAARQKELAEQQAHLEELKLNAALATLESTGQLAQFTGGLAVSANEAAELIRAGVLPVSQELGAAIQAQLAGLQEQEAAAATVSAENQAILTEAFAGTLTPIQEQETALGTNLPAAALVAQESMGIMNQEVGLGVQNTTMAIGDEDLALQNISGVTAPNLQMAMGLMNTESQTGLQNTLTATQDEDAALQNITNTTLPALQKAFQKTGEVGTKMANDIANAVEDAQDPFEDLIAIVLEAENAFEGMANAADRAASAAGAAGNVSEVSTGIGFSGGAGLQRGLGLQGGTLGLGMRVPGQARGDIFGPIFLEPQEEILVTPRGQSIEGLIFDRLASAVGKSVTVEVNVGQVNEPMDLAVMTEQIKRVVSEEIN